MPMKKMIRVLLVGVCLACKPPQPDVSTEFVGVHRCARCHLEAYQKWQRTTHATSMQEATPQTVKGDFTKNNAYTFGGITSAMSLRDGRHFITTPGADGSQGTHEVLYTIGDRDTQWYITELPGGHLQILPVYFDVRRNTWYNPVEGIIASPSDQPLDPRDTSFWMNFGRNWSAQCFDCHASQIEVNYDPDAGTYDSHWVDLSINCETCHGPGQGHVSFWERALTDADAASMQDTSLVNLKMLSAEQSVELCAQCHATKRILKLGYRPGDNFYDFYEPIVLDFEGMWPNGRYRHLAYNYTALTLSPCYTEGGLTCLTCHPSHGPEDGKKTRADFDGICMQCHRDIQPREHSRHEQYIACVDCHMPPIPEVRRVRVFDHRIASPVPANTVRFGIPNACGECHGDRTPEWAVENTEAWWGKQDVYLFQTAAIALGRQGNPMAVSPLKDELLDLSNNPTRRASAALLLGRTRSSQAVPVLLNALKDPHPLIRAKAVEGLGLIGQARVVPALVPLLNDPIRLVRFALVPAIENLGTHHLKDQDYERYRAIFAEYEQAAKEVWTTDPYVHAFLGWCYMRRGNTELAQHAFQRALRIWPGIEDATRGLAQIHNTEKNDR